MKNLLFLFGVEFYLLFLLRWNYKVKIKTDKKIK